MAFAPVLFPTPSLTSGSPATPGLGTSAFTPGVTSADNTSPAGVAAHYNTRMAAAVNNSSRSAAAALAAAGGVDPNSHHVTATLRRHVSAPADAASADEKRLGRWNGAANWAPTPSVKCSTAAGGGWTGDAVAVTRDADAKRAAWAAEMAALRAGLNVPATAGAATVPVTAAAVASRPQSVTVASAPRVAMSSWAARQARLSLHAEGSTAKATARKEEAEPSVATGSSPTVAPASSRVPEALPLEVAAASIAAIANPTSLEAGRAPPAQPARAPSRSHRTPIATPVASSVPAAGAKSLVAVLSPPTAMSPVEIAAASLAATEVSPLERAAASLATAASASPSAVVATPGSVNVTSAPVTKAAAPVAEVAVPVAPTAVPITEPVHPRVVHVRSAWGQPRTPVKRQVVHVRPYWGKPRAVAPQATAPPTPRVVHVRSAWAARRSYTGSPRVPRATLNRMAPVYAAAPVVPLRSMPAPAARSPVLASASAARSSTARGTGASTPAEKIVIPSFVTAAVTGTSTPASEADVNESDKATMPIALRMVVPPAVAAAFVGACLALSHASAVIGAGLPLN